MKLLLVILSFLFITNCASYNKFAYDQSYKVQRMRTINGEAHVWLEGAWTWMPCSYYKNKPEQIRTTSDKFFCEMCNRYQGHSVYEE